MSSRAYIKRVWRVPKDRGPAEYLATLIVKALRKHAWPAEWLPDGDGFAIRYFKDDTLWADAPPAHFAQAASIAIRVTAKAKRVDVTEVLPGVVRFNKPYAVTPAGFFKEVKHDLSGEGALSG